MLDQLFKLVPRFNVESLKTCPCQSSFKKKTRAAVILFSKKLGATEVGVLLQC